MATTQFGMVFGIEPQRHKFGVRLRRWLQRLWKPKDENLVAVTPEQAPKGMDVHQAAAWASHYKSNIVEAGAGAGKTFLVVERAALLVSKGIRSEEIGFVTFTKNATNELKERLHRRLGQELASGFKISTIHSFAKTIAKNLGLPSNYGFHNATTPKDPYRIAWRQAIERALSAPSGAQTGAILQAWLLERDLLREGLPFEHIYPELHGDPPIKTSVNVNVRSKAEKQILEGLVAAGYQVEYEWLFMAGKFPFRPDFFLPKDGLICEYLGLWDHLDKEVREGYRACYNRKRFELMRLGLENTLVPIYPSELSSGAWKAKINKARGNGMPEKISAAQAEVVKAVRGRMDSVVDLCTELAETLLRYEDRSKLERRYGWAVQDIVGLVRQLHGEVIQLLMDDETHESDSFIGALALYLQGSPERAKKALGELKYLFVDEFQDVYPGLFGMLLPLFEEINVFVIGDARQSIYGFLGGSPVFMERLQSWLPGVVRYQLPVNRRSTATIVRVSEAVLPAGMLKAIPANAEEVQVSLVATENEARDAQWVVNRALELGGSKDVAVLTRVGAEKAPQAAAYKEAVSAVGGRFYTFHSSKGTEADTVVVTGLVKKPKGSWNVPPLAWDHPLIEAVVRANGGEDKEAQERRLLYVALSRARRTMILVTDKYCIAPLALPALRMARQSFQKI